MRKDLSSLSRMLWAGLCVLISESSRSSASWTVRVTIVSTERASFSMKRMKPRSSSPMRR